MILLTGFEPFGGEATNPSWQAARLAADLLSAEGMPAAAVEVPCVFGRSVEVLAQAVEDHRPEIVLCVGQAGGRERISIERVAINVDDARIPDNAGRQPIDEPVVPRGPAAYFSTLPIKACREAVARLGIPVEVSQTAGTYVCNHIFYGLMDLLQRRDGVRGGFVHVPFSPEQGSAHGQPGLAIEHMAAALVAVARTTAGTTTDTRVTAGAEH
ncbi:pyroglutamyl-peptidase I [Arthrobacter sp. NamB2]|uniref:pyroglutamyl-peptidase I n=1 Tax=Arthrobacter sp. NamB2 TaxID=2576035 RepID=UPI0010C998F9|nr:pyroglutamyl-peptidase I [Arthrobacter sp. NamB2]TKV28001.1 pyroglutamyl-peptidase I [Arthrobacter sp. NamB2]